MEKFTIYLYIFIISIVIIQFFKKYNYEYFNNNPNIIISVYSPKVLFGFGDYIRGLIFLYQTQPESKIIADYRKHPISKFLYNKAIKNSEYIDYIEDDIIDFNASNHDINKDIEVLNKLQKPYALYINSMYLNNNISNEIREKIISTFTMKKSFYKLFLNTFDKNNLIENNFIVLHIRLDDKYFNPNFELPTFDYLDTFIIDNIIPTFSNNVLVMSNSYKFKKKICEKYNFKYYDNVPIHTGGDKQMSDKDLENTLIEFFTMSKALKIYQFCELSWQTSGFSKRISEIYGIDFIKI
jgi:hypothetical protein